MFYSLLILGGTPELQASQLQLDEARISTARDENATSMFSDPTADQFPFDEVFNPEMLSLLPFDLDGDILGASLLPQESAAGPDGLT